MSGGKWLPEADENENWIVRVKPTSYEHRGSGLVSQAVLWVLERAGQGLKTEEVAERLGCDLAPVHPNDFHRECLRVRNLLDALQRKGKVWSEVEGNGNRRKTTWYPGSAEVTEVNASALPAISDDEWDRIISLIPPASLRYERIQQTRDFVAATIYAARLSKYDGLTSPQRKRFTSWFEAGVWRHVAQTLHSLPNAQLEAMYRHYKQDV